MALAIADPRMAELVGRFGRLPETKRTRGRPRDPYGALVRAVVGQQLSTKAAATIYGRVADLYGGDTPTPAELLATEGQTLRDAGLSWRKVEYLRDLARRVESGELELDRLDELSDAEVIAEITAVKGFGVWTAEVFLMLHLRRPDVLPAGDLGIRQAMKNLYELDELPDRAEAERIAEPWRPHRSLACLYLWESLGNAPA
ncbi:DNA-3-methyladenine glycosylase 2 family protein [Thermoleophilia bacterium SCSIO 60948]|nr:DNA-3-methyladenine glycosylase 2 family protein [Thermoleophilia bacterium SCSIO 60948]